MTKNAGRPVVAHYLRTFAGPTETFVVNQVAAIRGYETLVLARDARRDAPSSTVGPYPSAIAYTDRREQTSIGRLLYDKAKLPLRSEGVFYRDVLAEHGAGIIHGHFGSDTAYLFNALGRCELPVVVSYYGYDVSRLPRSFSGLGVRYYRRLFREASLHLAMTPRMAEQLVAIGAPADSVVVHHHGIDSEHWSEIDDDRRVPGRILMVARFHEKKGHADLLDALPTVVERFPETTVHLVGEGPIEGVLRKRVQELSLTSVVKFCGFKNHEQMRDEYAEASLFVHPSRTSEKGDEEGLPGSILEAMAAGLPVVSTIHAGIPHAVIDGRSGMLVPEGDVHGLADAVRQLLSDQAMRETYGAEGRCRVKEDFDVRRQGERLESIYDRVLDAPKASVSLSRRHAS